MGLAWRPNLRELIRTYLFPPNHGKNHAGTEMVLGFCGQGLADSPDLVALGRAQGQKFKAMT